MDFGFQDDIENFLNQPKITKLQFDEFKLQYCLKYNLKDKNKLLFLFKKLENHFVEDIYNGPKNIINVLDFNVSKSDKSHSKKLIKQGVKKKKGKNNVQKKKAFEKKIKLSISNWKNKNYQAKILEQIKPKKGLTKIKKHPDSHYHLLKLKRVFLKSDITLRKFAKELRYEKEYYLAQLQKEFPNVTLDTILTEEHLKYGIEDFYYDYLYLQNDLKNIVTKLPKTKPNYYKLIYTR